MSIPYAEVKLAIVTAPSNGERIFSITLLPLTVSSKVVIFITYSIVSYNYSTESLTAHHPPTP